MNGMRAGPPQPPRWHSFRTTCHGRGAEALRRPATQSKAGGLDSQRRDARKLTLARCFLGSPRLVVLTEPTSGVDVGARAAIYDTLRSQARGGVGVIVISSDFDEIHDVCDRCLVLRRGRIVQELTGAALTVRDHARCAVTGMGHALMVTHKAVEQTNAPGTSPEVLGRLA